VTVVAAEPTNAIARPGVPGRDGRPVAGRRRARPPCCRTARHSAAVLPSVHPVEHRGRPPPIREQDGLTIREPSRKAART